MTRNNLAHLIFLAAALLLASPARAEEESDAGSEDRAESPATEKDAEETGSAEETAAPEAEESGEGEAAKAQPEAAKAPATGAGLDLSALGEIDPEKELGKTGKPAGGEKEEKKEKSAKDWTERALDVLELHGYFRVRPELFHNFQIRGDNALYTHEMVRLINADTDPTGYLGEDCRTKSTRRSCKNSTLAGANMRFRLEPTINVSEEIWIKSQIDFLDNVMLGSTPRYWQNWGDYTKESQMIEAGRLSGWDMGPPGSDQMVVVRRAWGEVLTPFGQIRFGRMGDHWGLGMLHNAGNAIDQDFGDSVDRLMFAAKINDWTIAPAFDFPNEGRSGVDASGRPFDVTQLDDSYQIVGIFAYKHDAEEQLAMIKRGDWVINTGLYFPYRWQVLSFETDPEETLTQEQLDSPGQGNHFYRRDMWNITPDFWLQLLLGTFHLELEFAFVYGEVGNPDRTLSNFDEAKRLTLLQYGGVLQIDYGLLSDQLRIGLEFGFSSGDGDVEGLRAPATYDQLNNPDNRTYSVFAMNPARNIDFILYQHILGSPAGSYYFKAWLRYDFLKNALGRNLGLEADVLYSRAWSERSTINNHSGHLGVELDIQALYRTEDHFYAGIKYGVLFPLNGFKGKPYWDDTWGDDPFVTDRDLSIPQVVQALLGITY